MSTLSETMLPPTFSRLVPVLSKMGDARTGRSIMIRYFKSDEKNGEKFKCPTVIYVPGFMSHGLATKSEILVEFCAAKNYNYLCYDPEGKFSLHKNRFPYTTLYFGPTSRKDLV